MPVITTSAGSSYVAGDGEPLLDAALRSGITFEHSCKTGRCSSCKARAPRGSTLALHEELGLSKLEREEGWILTCVRAAITDVSLEVAELGAVQLYPAKTLPCRIDALARLSSDVVQVWLRLPPNADFRYHAGQYIDVIGHGGVRRSYSIANAPGPDPRLELHIRQVAGGEMSDYWFGRARPNDLLRLQGPLGTFFLRDIVGRNLVFLATGTGIGPVKAMLEALLSCPAEQLPRSVTVYWGGRVPADLYCDASMMGVPHQTVTVLSRAPSGWTGARGHVQEVLMADDPNLTSTTVYACGSDAMIHGARALLTAAGLPSPRFRSDAFVCSAAAQ